MRVHATYGMTVVFVTHDIDESVYLADRVIVLTKSPTEVQEEFAVDLPQPRDQVATKELPRFAELRAHVYTAIKGKAAARARTVPTGIPST
jgi:NitT/TauT family transport system ATP-binding protein